jgi:hypothetical protein
MDKILLEIIENAENIVEISKNLNEIEDFENVDYSDVLTDIKWNKMVLENRLNDINRK